VQQNLLQHAKAADYAKSEASFNKAAHLSTHIFGYLYEGFKDWK